MPKGSGSGKNYRSAGSGQFVKKSYADKNPSTTVGEARGGGSTHSANRSAVTGKFVQSSYASRNPSKTIKDSWSWIPAFAGMTSGRARGQARGCPH